MVTVDDNGRPEGRVMPVTTGTANVITGLALIALGLIFFADRQGWLISWHLDFMRLWPLILIVIGIGRVIEPVDVTVDNGPAGVSSVRQYRLGNGLWLVVVGVLLLLHENHVLRIEQSWPLFIVVAGIALMFGERRRPRRRNRGGRDGN